MHLIIYSFFFLIFTLHKLQKKDEFYATLLLQLLVASVVLLLSGYVLEIQNISVFHSSYSIRGVMIKTMKISIFFCNLFWFDVTYRRIILPSLVEKRI